MNIVFDFGAVLFDWRPAQVIARHFPQADHVQLAKEVFGHADWHAFDAGLLSQEETIEKTLVRTGLKPEALQAMVAQIPDALQPIASSVALLKTLVEQKSQRGLRSISFLSNMPEPYARVLQQRHEFLTLFDSGIFSGDVKLAKPDPAIYALTEARLQSQGEDILFIDDHPANITAAQNRGWQTVHLTEPSSLPELMFAKLGESVS